MHIINEFCCDTIIGKRDKNPVIDADDTDILHLAMCHAGASVTTWNQIFAMDVSEKWDTKGLEQYISLKRVALQLIGATCCDFSVL
jgi:hypothetical protein